MSEEAFRRELEIIARILVASPKAYRAVMQEKDAGVRYVFQDMATNQAMRLANITRLDWPLRKTDHVPAPVQSIRDALNVSLSEGNLPVILIYHWTDEHWGIAHLPGPFEINWETRKHKKTGEPLYLIPLKDFKIIMNYANKSNTPVKLNRFHTME